jgi:hypothetical protein
MKRIVLIHEKDLNLGSRNIVWSEREIEETDDCNFFCVYKNKRLRLEENEDARCLTSLIAVEVIR